MSNTKIASGSDILVRTASSYYTKRTSITVDNSRWFEILQPNAGRWSVAFTNATPNSYLINPSNSAPLTEGLMVTNALGMITILTKDFPALVTGNLFAVSAGFVATTVEIWEQILVGF